MRARLQPARVICALIALSAVSGCARVPEGRYGVNRLVLEGTERLDPHSVEACLATHERDRFTINLGRTDTPECGDPPFDAGRLRLPLWRWPWSDWPLFDRVTFDRDIQRIERWYRARGYYDAEVTQVSFTPSSAGESDRFTPDERPCPEERRDQGCEIDISVQIREGDPVIVQSITITGQNELPTELQARVSSSVALRVGQPFDESAHDSAKTAMINALRESSYACAIVDGDVTINPGTHSAGVSYQLAPGPRARIGELTISGATNVPITAIRAAANLERGAAYQQSDLVEAQRAVYALGAFSSVTVEPNLSAETCADEVPIHLAVTRGRAIRGGVGGGIQVGVEESLGAESSIAAVEGDSATAQWDIHLRALFEHRNFLGGLRQLRIEERPRLIFPNQFPRINTDPIVGNQLLFRFRQPAFVEPQTTLSLTLSWDLGPDNYNLNYRHNLESGLELARSFFRGRLHVSGGIHGSVVRYLNQLDANDGAGRPPDYHLLFLQQSVRLDLRDNPRRPRSGLYVGLGLHETGYVLPSSWEYIRFTGDVRFYVPLPFGMVLASRFSVGTMRITNIDVSADSSSDETCGGLDCAAGECSGTPSLTSSCPLIAEPNTRRELPASINIDDRGNVSNASSPPDATLCQFGQLCLGPDEYRLRGGGSTGNRGFRAGTLGDPQRPQAYTTAELDQYSYIQGGIRRWEGSLELRIPLGESLEIGLFADMGDVNRLPKLRFDYLHLALGAGVRLQTLVGPIRFDFGYRVPGMQVLGEDHPTVRDSDVWDRMEVHLTIGEAF